MSISQGNEEDLIIFQPFHTNYISFFLRSFDFVMTIVFCHFRNLCEFKLNYLPVFVLVDESAFQLSYKISLSIDT